MMAACSAGPSTDHDEPSTPVAALVVTSDFESGSYSTVDLSTHAVNADVAAIHPDAVCRFETNLRRPFIIERFGADAVDVIAPDKHWAVARQYSVGAGTNPQDIAAVSGERAYVARLGSPELLVVHPLTGKSIEAIDLSVYADDDGVPDVTWLYALDGEVFALLARLENFKPTDESTLLVLDGATGAVETAIPLTHTNPSGKLRYHPTLNRFVIIETGGFSSLGGAGDLDGIVELFDPITRTVSGPVITAEALGGDIIDAVIVSATNGVAIIEKGAGNDLVTELVAFNPATGQKGEVIQTADTWAYSALALTPDGAQVWLADRTRTNPGIRIFDADSLDPLTDAPIDVGLPPFMICFGAPEETAVPEVDAGDGGTDTGPGAASDRDLVMERPPEETPLLDATACPVPSAPAFTIVPHGTTLEWTAPGYPAEAVQVGASLDVTADEPGDWRYTTTHTFDTADPPYAVKLFARTAADDCETTRVFSHVYNVRETFAGPPGETDTTAIDMDSPAIATWATGWVEPVAYGDEVIDDWRTPDRAVGPAEGTSGDVVSLGREGELVMTFDAPVRDVQGFDFAIFENSPVDGFLDLAFVAVSSDGETFVRFDSAALGTDPVDAFGTLDTRTVGGLAGKYRQGFGQPFDLRTLANRAAVLKGDVDLLNIRYIKLVDIIGDGTVRDSFGHPVYDPYPTVESAGFDLDAIGVLGSPQ